MCFSHRRQTRLRGRRDALFCASARADDGSVGLVCERVGGFGTLSRCVSAIAAPGDTKGRAEDVLVVGDVGRSSNSVSIARSSAPVDLEIVRDE